jgi:hypothetical protein
MISVPQARSVDVLIVGAGLAGLSAARVLRERGLDVHLIDKGRSPGGRLATRRIGEGRADTGAQFFTVRDPDFGEDVAGWHERGWVSVWSYGWGAAQNGHPRYRATGGFATLARRLAEPLSLTLDRRVTRFHRMAGGWEVETDDGVRQATQALIVTAPVPQAIGLLEASDLAAPAALRAVHYAPCLAGLFQIDGGTGLPKPGVLQQVSERISWVCDNQQKGISPEACLLTVHASPGFSVEAQAWTDDAALAALWGEIEPLCAGARRLDQQLKRWRYAQTIQPYPARAVCLVADPPLVLAGDGFGEARIEGAARSGRAAADLVYPT